MQHELQPNHENTLPAHKRDIGVAAEETQRMVELILPPEADMTEENPKWIAEGVGTKLANI